MKMKLGMGRKLRYGGISAAFTAVVIAIVIIVNVAFSALAQKLVWYTDLTPTVEFTLSENCIAVFEEGDTTFSEDSKTDGGSPIKKIDADRQKLVSEGMSEEEAKEKTIIRIIFCSDMLTWTGDEIEMKWVWKTAADLEKKFPDHIRLEYVDTVRNPTAVNKYGKVSESSVIITSGDEFRVRSLRNFYVFDTEDSETPWAYNGEKIFASAAMAITRATTPIACFTNNHSESLPGYELILTLSNAGYQYKEIDLTKEDIPEECRLLVISSPLEDFMIDDGISEVNEIEKIEKFLDESNSLMVFMSPTLTTPLENLEGFLGEWGIAFDRVEESESVSHPYRIQDLVSFYDSAGFTIGAEYIEYGLGADVTETVRESRRKIVFPNAMSLSYSTENGVSMVAYTDEESGEVLGDYGSLFNDGVSRMIYPVFTASKDAVALANGEEVAKAQNGNVLELMMISVEDRVIQEDDIAYSSVDQASYVLACGCPEFFSEAALQGQYGNNMFLENALRRLGHEPVPVGLTFRVFGDYDIDTIKTSTATWYMIILTAVPAVLALGVGVFVIVRRKNR